MGLETATYINELVPTNPTSADKRRFGDDHIRLVKAALQATFPNIDGEVLATLAEINFLQGLTSNLQEQLDAKLTSANLDLTPYAQLGVNNAWTQTQTIAPIDLGTVAGTVTLDMRATNTYILTAIGAVDLNFTNLAEGQEVTVKVAQGTTGSHAISFLTGVAFSFGTAPVFSIAAGSYDILAGKVVDGVLVFGFLADVQNV